MPIEEFMRKFVPKAPTDAPKVEYRVDHVKSEKDLEAVVVSAVLVESKLCAKALCSFRKS